MKVRQNVVLAPFTTFHIGGSADYFVSVSSAEELMKAVLWAQDKNLPFFVLGKGANILIGDKGFRGLVIKNEANEIAITENKSGAILTAQSGAVIADLIALTVEKGLGGLEHFAGIPSSLGGAIWQNLHFLSYDRTKTVFIGDIVKSAKVFTGDTSEIKDVSHDYFQFAYDDSILHHNKDVVLEATLILHKEDPEILKEIVAANIAWRKEKHPEGAEKCSAGSVFKKLEGFGAGRLIDNVGLKGKQIGGAKISEKHANFIINTGNAKASDVRALIALIQEKIQEKYNLHMQPEISFVGDF